MSGPRGVAILGATGSIGTSALNVVRRHRDRFRVVALTAHENVDALDDLAREFEPAVVCVTGRDDDTEDGRWAGDWRFGDGCVLDAVEHPDVEVVLNALVGIAGLESTIRTLESGRRLALANKESLVAGGTLVLDALERGGGELLPVDSEHSAIHQCIAGQPAGAVDRITLTASGGPFSSWPLERLSEVTPEDALAHPTWEMGAKITIDSATLANKALEVIEAHVLFGVPYERIDVVIHPTSIVHSFVEMVDGSCLAQLGRPTMEIPILYALGHPERIEDPREAAGFDPLRDGPLEFAPVREDAFPLFTAGVRAGEGGGELPIAFNAANEVAVAAFLQHRIGFRELAEVVIRTLDGFSGATVASAEQIWRIDARARDIAGAHVASLGGDATESPDRRSRVTIPGER